MPRRASATYDKRRQSVYTARSQNSPLGTLAGIGFGEYGEAAITVTAVVRYDTNSRCDWLFCNADLQPHYTQTSTPRAMATPYILAALLLQGARDFYPLILHGRDLISRWQARILWLRKPRLSPMGPSAYVLCSQLSKRGSTR